jgi:hyperosmotically inducible protein
MKSKYYCVSLLVALPISALMIGCERNNDTSSSMGGTNTSSTLQNDNTNAGIRRDADNTGLNERDRDTNNLTPGDQGNSPADLELTRKIRNALVMDSNYSTTAKNVKIITVDGKVTLRGPVNSDSEKSGVESLAKNIAGDGNVDNQLEVKSNP